MIFTNVNVLTILGMVLTFCASMLSILASTQIFWTCMCCGFKSQLNKVIIILL